MNNMELSLFELLEFGVFIVVVFGGGVWFGKNVILANKG